MQRPVLSVCFPAPVLFDTSRGPKGDGTEDTFLALNDCSSTSITSSGTPYLIENRWLDANLTFAVVFAPFSLYSLWKTCTFVQGCSPSRPDPIASLSLEKQVISGSNPSARLGNSHWRLAPKPSIGPPRRLEDPTYPQRNTRKLCPGWLKSQIC
jgi:hypothetical protein